MRMSGKPVMLPAGFAIPALFFVMLMTSCIGINADIAFNSDYSGTITLEYRISSLMESLGKQDGNENYPVIPAGKTDIERTLARVPGMKLLSWNSRDTNNDKIITFKIQFPDINTLVHFLDASGQKAVYAREGNTSKMTFVLNAGGQSRNRDLETLVRQVCRGYDVSVSVSLPAEGRLNLLDNTGQQTEPAALKNAAGKKLSFSLPLETVLFAPGGMKAEFIW